jgi:rhomboid protease GluP
LPLPLRWRWKIDRLRERFSSTFGSQEKQRRPRLCPACGTLVGSTANRCHACGASLTFSVAAMSRSFSKYLPSESPATYLILGACGLLYGISLLLTMRIGGEPPASGSPLNMLMNLGGINPGLQIQLGASLPLRANLAQPWRFVTANFLHWNLLHIAFNMWFLVYVGPIVEEIYGSARSFFLFVVTGIGGYALSSFLGGFSAGASAGLVGFIGVLLAVTSRRKSAGMQMLRSQVMSWIIFLVIMAFWPGMRVDNMAHLGGGITGFILGKLMADRQPSTTEERKHAYALAWATAAVVLLSFGFVIFGFHSHLFLRGFPY